MNKTFAVMNGTTVTNTIVAPDLATAEEVTGFTCVEYWKYPVESGYINFHSPWSGHSVPVSPSILFDAPARCGNQWSVTLLNQAFPTAFQRWGFQEQHSPKSFTEETNAFDIIITSLRKPVDALASEIVMVKIDTNDTDSVLSKIRQYARMLEAIFENKERVSIFTFESLTQTPEKVIGAVAKIIGVTPQPVDKDALLLSLKTVGSGYAVPANNQDELIAIVAKLNEPRFAELLSKVNSLYANLLTCVVPV
jgi:hypothetical protein